MKTLYFILVILVSLTSALFTQTPPDTLWTRTFGGSNDEHAYCVQQTSDGGFIISGSTSSFGAGGSDVWLIKTDPNGNISWTQTFGGIYDDEAWHVQQCTDGGYIIAGNTASFGMGELDIWLIKSDTNGDTLWTRTFGGVDIEYGRSVQETNDGGYIITGTTYSFGMGEGDIILVKTDELGDEIWTQYIGGVSPDEGYIAKQTLDGGYIIAATTRSYGAGWWDYYLVKTDSDGNIQWTNTFGGGAGDGGRYVEQTTDEGYIFAGWSCSFGHGYYDAYLVKTDSQGNPTWTGAYGGYAADESQCARQTFDGGYISIGYSHSFSAGSSDLYVVRIDDQGNDVWTSSYGGVNEDRGWSIDLTEDGGYILVGGTLSYGAGSRDVYLIRLASETSIEDNEIASPAFLVQNYPNPFNPSTTISFSVTQNAMSGSDGSSFVTLIIYNIKGQKVKQLVSDQLPAGQHSVVWDGTDDKNKPVSSGIYLYKLKSGSFEQTKKMILLR